MTNMVLPQNVQEFVCSEAGSHLFMLMLENAFGHSIRQFNPIHKAHFEKDYGCDSSIEMDLELLLNHLSRIRVVADLNSHAEDCLISYWNSEDSTVFLIDAKNYVMDALRIAPKEHPEMARAYKNLAYLLLARNKVKMAMDQIHKALDIFLQNRLAEPIEELLEMVSSRPETVCQMMKDTVAAVLRKMEVGAS